MSILPKSRTTRLQFAFFFFDFLYLAAGAIMIVVAEVFRMTGSGMSDAQKKSGNVKLDGMTLRRLIVSDKELLSAVVLGVLFLVSFLISLPSYYLSSRRRRNSPSLESSPARRKAFTLPLAVFNWSLVVTGLGTIIVGIALWFFTLRERTEFQKVWDGVDTGVQAFLQDQLKCCGYFNATSSGLFNANTGFCAGVPGSNATAIQGCVTPIVTKGDTLLNELFSTIFGFMAVQACLFLATVCLINDRHEEERFRKIDEKRGIKGGFV